MASLASAGLFLGMLLFAEVGRRFGLAQIARDQELTKGAGAAEAAVLGLLGLLFAFTFSGAASRFETRRDLVVQEANAIGTAYLRIDLLPREFQPEMRDLFRRYLDGRLALYRDWRDPVVMNETIAKNAALQTLMWSNAVAAGQAQGASAQATMLMLPALNELIDVTATRSMATLNHQPLVVLLLLGGLSLVGAALVGYGTAAGKGRTRFHSGVYAAILSLTVYVIVDLEYPRIGLVRVDAADQVLLELRQSME